MNLVHSRQTSTEEQVQGQGWGSEKRKRKAPGSTDDAGAEETEAAITEKQKDSKKSEKVNGTDGDDLIADGRGKDKLIGGDGADQFYFAGEEPFKKKAVDKVIDFDASEGDIIVIADEVIGDLTEDPTLAVADTKKDLKQLSKDGYDLLYFEPKGDLYVDGNGDSKGFGKKSEGGMIADLPNDTILTESDVLIGV